MLSLSGVLSVEVAREPCLENQAHNNPSKDNISWTEVDYIFLKRFIKLQMLLQFEKIPCRNKKDIEFS